MNDGSGFQKRRQLLEMLDAGLVMLHLDPRPPDVIVPARFKSDPVLRLNLAYQFRLPSLDIGVEGVYAVLSFDKQNFGCTLPWSAIFAATRPNENHEGIVWPESVPEELKSSFTRAGVNEPTRLRATPTPPAPLAVVAEVASVSSTSESESESDSESDNATQPMIAAEATPDAAVGGEGDAQPMRRRGHLTLIKG